MPAEMNDRVREQKRPGQRRFRRNRHGSEVGEAPTPSCPPDCCDVCCIVPIVETSFNDGIDQWESGEGRDFGTVVFHIIRNLKGHPQFLTMSVDDALDFIHNVLAGLGYESIEERLEEYDDDPLTQFRILWSKVRVPIGTTEPYRAVIRADYSPLKLPGHHSEKFIRFVSAAYYLQLERGEQTIYFAPALWCRLFGVSEMCLSNWKTLATQLGFLDLVSPAVSKHKAAEFRFDVSRFPSRKAEYAVTSGGETDLDDDIPW